MISKVGFTNPPTSPYPKLMLRLDHRLLKFLLSVWLPSIPKGTLHHAPDRPWSLVSSRPRGERQTLHIPIGGYCFPFISTPGSQLHRSFSGTSSRTDATWAPQPHQVTPSALGQRVTIEAIRLHISVDLLHVAHVA